MKRREEETLENNLSPMATLPIDQLKLEDLLENNPIKDLEVRIYGRRKGKEERTIQRHIKRLGVKVVVKESEDKRQVIVKLKNHLKFVILQIEESK